MPDNKPWSLVGEGKEAYVCCPVPEGWSSEVIQGVQVAIPPEGYVKDPFGKGLVYLGVDKKNPEPDDFYWIRQGLPKDYSERLREEEQKRKEDPDYSDAYIEAFRQGVWIRRLSGCWFSNGAKGEAVYISGLHYYYLEWCFIAAHGNKGYPSYRKSDRDFFLFIEHTNRNPHCFGTLLLTKRREGKALAIDTPIPTPTGFVKMGDLKQGDTVFDENGKPCKVTFVTEVMYQRKCYRVTFDDGASIIADAEHQWTALDKPARNVTCKRYGKWRTLTTQQMLEEGLYRSKNERNFQMPMPKAASFEKTSLLPIDPYVLGLWLADGEKNGAKFSTSDEEVLQSIAAVFDINKTKHGKYDYYIGKNKEGESFRSLLKGMGLLNNKHIPEIYKTSDYDNRLALLQGVMDGDAYSPNKGRIEISQKSKTLALDILELMRSLGIKAKMNVSKSTLYGKDCGDRHRIGLVTDQPVFRLKRRMQAVHENGILRKHSFRMVESIEPVDSVPVRCIEVDSPSHLYLAGRDYIVTHNTQKSVAFGLEAVTRSGYGNFGIQSKTAEDAAKVVFKDSAIRMFARLPEFFKPIHDDRRLMNISNTLVFRPKQTDISTFKEGRFLGGWIEHRSATETSFDGTKLLRYVGDEVFKTQVGVDVYERWNVVKFCLIVDGKIRGKAMLTSTVEEIEGSTDMYIKMYADSDQLKIDEIGRTRTGLFRFFLPADEARNRDKYGHCDKDANRDEILLERKAYAGDTMTYNSLVRKEPLTVEEAFRFLSKDSIFDVIKISDQIDLVAWRQDELLERGNYVWKTYGKEVNWVPTQKGRWLRVRNYPHPVTPLSEEDNTAYKTDYRLMGTNRYVCGIDPFSHSRVEGRQKSDGAFYVKRKNDPMDPEHSDMFVAQYIYRTSEVEQFYEDVFITLFVYGCQGLIENNKIGMVAYFENERVQNYLMKIKGQKNYGIAATKKTTQAMCEMIEKYIYENINKVYFTDLLKDWANFDIDDTQEFDAAMASGYTLLADSKILLRKSADRALKIIEIGDLF